MNGDGGTRGACQEIERHPFDQVVNGVAGARYIDGSVDRELGVHTCVKLIRENAIYNAQRLEDVLVVGEVANAGDAGKLELVKSDTVLCNSLNARSDPRSARFFVDGIRYLAQGVGGKVDRNPLSFDLDGAAVRTG